jgi:hypothetical protein
VRVHDGATQVIAFGTKATTVRSLEYVSFSVPLALHEKRDSAHDGLHHPTERAHALAQYDVEVIRHHGRSQQHRI